MITGVRKESRYNEIGITLIEMRVNEHFFDTFQKFGGSLSKEKMYIFHITNIQYDPITQKKSLKDPLSGG